MNKTNRINECEYQGRLNSLLKGAFNTQLQPLRSLNTATKKRRAAKKQAASQSDFAKSSTATPADTMVVAPSDLSPVSD
jgi:hypothetical protein